MIADGYLELQPKARVIGDVTYKTLEMHVGAVLRGTVESRRTRHRVGGRIEASRIRLSRIVRTGGADPGRNPDPSPIWRQGCGDPAGSR